MKRTMLYTLLLSLTVALMGCGGDGKDEPKPSNVTITVSQENIAIPANGGTYSINVSTTGNEWGAYADQDFVTVETKNSTSQSGVHAVTVAANPMTSVRTSTVTIMSKSARKSIEITQDAAAESAYYAPEGYQLVWHDEFDADVIADVDE